MNIIKREDIASAVGKVAEPSAWHTVTQEQINAFADCTLDHQFIHVDPEKAKQSPFGTTIAHGFLSLSMLSHFSETAGFMIEGTQMGVNYGCDKVRFLAPVKVNSRIRGVAKLMSIEEKHPGQFMVKSEFTVEIEGEAKPALIAEWIGMLFVA
ncbi:MaoC family dehydratase [uncultured Pseudoteredinibacter sp.]|uniref:MaoC family dehydratase n=1 Tax=uncultured Pseudoteredinibacter sp. TaxID=1641701 RepID=UPI002623540C|nr:MaoC family dehydratase [uncultured Pseudoteredinibacter sp.]